MGVLCVVVSCLWFCAVALCFVVKRKMSAGVYLVAACAGMPYIHAGPGSHRADADSSWS